jgi:DNA-binding transcriptional LysR family regulator
LDEVKAGLFHAAGFVPNIVQVASQTSTLFALVAAQIGVMLTPGSASRITHSDVAFVPIQTGLHAELYLVTRREQQSAGSLNFCRVVRELASGTQEPQNARRA